MIGRTVSHYKILTKLGEGGMGVVYKARDCKLGRFVVLKFLAEHFLADADARRRFFREADIAAKLDHPNICSVYDFEEVAGRPFIVMSYLQGRDLASIIEDGPVAAPVTAMIGYQVANGLGAAHQKRIIHRDVKPSNILLTTEGRAVILDFGISSISNEGNVEAQDLIAGTTPYMSPERIGGESADLRSDLWSLGTVVYELLSGHPPFPGQYSEVIAYEILNEEPEPLLPGGRFRRTEAHLAAILRKALVKDPCGRYQSADQFSQDLQNALGAEGDPRQRGLSLDLGLFRARTCNPRPNETCPLVGIKPQYGGKLVSVNGH